MDDIGVAPYRLVVRKGHPLDGADTITPQQLSAYPVIGGSLVRRILDDQVLGSVGLRQPSLELDDYPLLIEAAVRSDAILVGSPLLVGSAWGRDLVPINIQLPEDRVNLRASVVTLEGRTLTPIARLIADRFASLLRRATGAVLETQKS